MAINYSDEIMATPTFSAKLPDVALSQLDALSKHFGISKSQIVIRAISDLYRKELKMDARQLADLAEQNPLEWQMHPDAVANGFDGIIYDAERNTWTVGSNGDYDTFGNKERAINALEWSWKQQAELHAE